MLDKAAHRLKAQRDGVWDMEEMPSSPSSSPGSGTCSILPGTGAAASDCY